MTTKKHHKLIIQVAIILAFVFGLIVAMIAKRTASIEMGLVFLGTIQLVVLLAILYLLETIVEVMEKK